MMKEDRFPLKARVSDFFLLKLLRRGVAYASYEGRTDDLWCESAKTTGNVLPCHRDRTSNSVKEVVVSSGMDTFDDVKGSDRTLNMKRTFKPRYVNFLQGSMLIRVLRSYKLFRFHGLSQVASSPLSSDSDLSGSLSTSAVGRILKQAATKTACLDHETTRNSEINSAVKTLASEICSTNGTRLRPKIRKSGSGTVSQPPDVMVHEDNSSKRFAGDMMALRARMTERLEQRNREIAKQLAEKTAQAMSHLTDEVETSGRRKNIQTSTDTELPIKKVSHSTLSSHEDLAHPLIEWQPAVPSRLSLSALYGFDEPFDEIHPSASNHQTANVDSQCEPVNEELVKKGHRGTSACPKQSNPAFHDVPSSHSRTEVHRIHPTSIRTSSTHMQSKYAESPKSIANEAMASSSEEIQLRSRSAPEVICGIDEPHSKVLPVAKKAESADLLTNRIPAVKQERTSFVVSGTVRRFLFTSISPQERLRLSGMISRLGAIADSGELNDHSTHLLCGKLIRGSKLMGCIASGRWIVSTDYVDKSLNAGIWLPEEDFEFGNPTQISTTNLSERELKLAQACRRWRLKLANSDMSKRVGAFHNWRCALYCSNEKSAGLIPMLKAGGAEVVLRKEGEGAPHTFRPTHAIVCVSNMWNFKELEMLVNIGAKIFQLDYISKYLLEEHIDEAASYHMDYKKYLLEASNAKGVL
ncbi:hypothetical protein DICVIV_08625 [Dictyocaulus viviparus]|uniref:TopBP1/SLF1 BRCT domain-containing protein n=1 Tax=Dictyocaulus viviparus TaxID=29172 RepID=A0A0D8XNH8_DICVI|nr:hypothetical protein DICVIV_08625 [Dictyocaulus viviparus]